MIPLSAQAPSRARGAQRDFIHGQVLGERLAETAEVPAAQCRIERGCLVGRHGTKVILQILPPQQPGRRLLRAGGIGRPVAAAHGLPHRGRVPLECQAAQRGVEFETQPAPCRGVGGRERRARHGLRIRRVEHLGQRPFELRKLGQNGLPGIGRLPAQELCKLASIPADGTVNGGMRGHEFPAQRDEDLVTQYGVQHGIGVVERLDQPHPVGIAVNAEALPDGQRRRIDDGVGNRIGPAQHMGLQLPLAIGATACLFSPGHAVLLRHAARRACRPASSRAVCSSATSSPNSGMLSSRSIMVGTAPKCATAAP